jgi:UDP-N-acetylenolpyruvoylglucosamine reductase
MSESRPAYANADGKVVVFFQNAGKFSYRYSTLGFQEAANLDGGRRVASVVRA